MTIPAGNIYCPSCEEICHDHPRICTVCGTALVSPPEEPASGTNRTRGTNQQDDNMFAVVPEQLVEQIRENSRTLTDLLRHVQHEVDVTRQAQQDLMESLQNLRQEFQSVPARLMDPNGAPSSTRPTAKRTLQEIPRILLGSNNSLLCQASISFVDDDQKLVTMEAVPGEFGDDEKACLLQNAILIVAESKTGKGGTLSTATQEQVQELRRSAEKSASDEETSKKPPAPPVIIYMERGDGVTYVQKALLAQNAGAQAVIIGNNIAEPWPYVMRDSQNEAQKHKLVIPVVMIKQQDGRALLSQCSKTTQLVCTLDVSLQTNKDCVICTDSFQAGQTALRLPGCGHAFHEACAVQWLEHHNTCPYCRRELLTDDPEYEEQRRRTQRTHAGSSTNNGNANWNTFYG
jgi:hypothetical protein